MYFLYHPLYAFLKERLLSMQFINYNANPKGRKTTDCVIRAMSTALNNTWEDTYRALVDFSIKRGLASSDKRAITLFLHYKGYTKQKMHKREDNTRYSVKDFIDEIAKPKAVYIIGLANHLTVVKDGVLLDTWNCSKKIVNSYWIID